MPPLPPTLDADLRFAAGRGQIVPRFAPLLRSDGRVGGFLVHQTWMHPVLGPLGPERILPRAVRLGLAAAFDRWIVDQACEHVARWGGEALDALSLLVVPCSQASSREPDVLQGARAAADIVGMPSERLVLAWPGRALSSVWADAHDRLGVGMGATELSALRDPRVDAVVLGRASMRRLVSEPSWQDQARWAVRLGTRVIARGVDPSLDRARLVKAGVTLVESGPPLSADDARARLTASPAQTA